MRVLSSALRCDGYVAEIAFDDSADAFHGRVVGLRDVIDFYGRTPEELRAAFREAVDDYRAWCGERGEEPDGPAPEGGLTFRPSEEQRRRFLAAAASRRMSLDSWALGVLDRASHEAERGIADIGAGD